MKLGLSSWKIWAAALATVVLASCGGGGSKSGDPLYGGGGSTDPTSQSVARLSLVLLDSGGVPASQLSNSGVDRITAKVTALDANNTVVTGAVVTFSVDAGAELAPADTLTDANGAIVAQIGIGANRANRVVNVTASSADGSVRAAAQFNIVGAKISGTVQPVMAPGENVTVDFLLEDSSKNPMRSESVTLSVGGNVVDTQTTSSIGKASFDFTAPANPGPYRVVATGAGATYEVDIQVQSSTVAPAVGPINSATAAANPSVVGSNPSGTDNSTTVRALFRGPNNAAIRNVRVWFTLPDPNSVGGTMRNSGIVYSDATGEATNDYIPGAISSPTDGVVVRACYSLVDFAVPATSGTCPAGTQQVDTRLTVVENALRVEIGTDEIVGLGDVTYTKDFVVIVTDAAGRAKSDVEVTARLDLTGFYKGYYGFAGTLWTRGAGELHTPACPNEDVNRNGTLEFGEDTNGNGELDPGGVSISPGSTRTGVDGKAKVRLEYPRDRATWIDYAITVTARVGGSEGVRVYRGNLEGLGNLPAPGSALSNQNVTPAFAISPYGRSAGCDNTN